MVWDTTPRWCFSVSPGLWNRLWLLFSNRSKGKKTKKKNRSFLVRRHIKASKLNAVNYWQISAEGDENAWKEADRAHYESVWLLFSVVLPKLHILNILLYSRVETEGALKRFDWGDKTREQWGIIILTLQLAVVYIAVLLLCFITMWCVCVWLGAVTHASILTHCCCETGQTPQLDTYTENRQLLHRYMLWQRKWSWGLLLSGESLYRGWSGGDISAKTKEQLISNINIEDIKSKAGKSELYLILAFIWCFDRHW